MTDTLKPGDERGVQEAVSKALADATPLEIMGAGTKQTLGRPVAAGHALSLAGLAGITLYEPEELVLTARAGTKLVEIEQALSENNQCLAFEPPDWRGLLKAAEGDQTIGGIVAANLAGPRRLQAGAARDHFLGARMVTGRGEIVRIGGRVVKNVTGYDLCKLLAGSFGTLAVLTEVTLKILPAAEKTRTVLVFGLEAAAAQDALTAALSSPNEVSAAAHLPADIASRSAVGYVAGAASAVTALRIEGLEPSVEARCMSLRGAMAAFGQVEELHFHNSRKFWQEVGNVSPFIDYDGPVWRLSVPPAGVPSVIADICRVLDVEHFVDWGGGLVWLRIKGNEEDAGAAIIRDAIATDGGHATLIRAAEEKRARVPVFQPQPDALTRLSGRIKDGYDPAHILNPGRMVAGSLASGV